MHVVQSLSGTLIWEWNKNGFFTGQFRFTDNSGSYDIGSDCIVRRGSFLRSNHKLVCLVLNVGRTCQSSLERKPVFKCNIRYLCTKIGKFLWSRQR